MLFGFEVSEVPMEIGLLYSSKDPRHLLTRDFVRRFVSDRGILANLIEVEQSVEVPTITINGSAVEAPAKRSGATGKSGKFPSITEIEKALEKGFWCL
ncbi:MAG: hypothetical protein ABIE70_07650 [bacterium]